ncbi:MAG: hypothetical protein ABI868_17230 [Acidobacteriota bacterium]
MGSRNYTITVDDHARGRLADLGEQLRQAGFEVAQQLDAIGVILGRAEDADLPRIRGLQGVAAIEEDRTIEPWSPDHKPK